MTLATLLDLLQLNAVAIALAGVGAWLVVIGRTTTRMIHNRCQRRRDRAEVAKWRDAYYTVVADRDRLRRAYEDAWADDERRRCGRRVP